MLTIKLVINLIKMNRTISLLAAIATLPHLTWACMSDAACAGNDVEMCCYMNACTPSSNIGCKGTRIDFFRALQEQDEECQMRKLAE